MNRCIAQLNSLSKTKSQLKAAVQNIIKDFHAADNPNGNINQSLAQSLKKDCEPFGDNQVDHLCPAIKNLQTISKPKYHKPVNSYISFNVKNKSVLQKNLAGTMLENRNYSSALYQIV